MARVFETETIIVDPFDNTPITNQNLVKDFQVLEAAIISNIVRPSGVREITVGIVYDDAVTLQASISLFPILVGQNIADVTDSPIGDIGTIIHTEFVDSSLVTDTFRLTILTISEVGAQVNNFSTVHNQLDPSTPIVAGTPIADTGNLLESHLVNVGSLQHTTQEPTRGQGTINSVLITVSQA